MVSVRGRSIAERDERRPGTRLLRLAPRRGQKIDDHTVDITTTRPNLRMPEQLTHPTYGVIAPGSDPPTKPVGTGRSNSSSTSKINAWSSSVIRTTGATRRSCSASRSPPGFMPDDNSRALALRAGEIDLAADVPREAARDLASVPGLKVITSGVGSYEALYVNIHGDPPYDLGQERAVRQAVALARSALDRSMPSSISRSARAWSRSGSASYATIGDSSPPTSPRRSSAARSSPRTRQPGQLWNDSLVVSTTSVPRA